MASFLDRFRGGASGYAPIPHDGNIYQARTSTGNIESDAYRVSQSQKTRRAVKMTGIGLMLVLVSFLAIGSL